MKTLLTLLVALLFSLTAHSQKACDDCFDGKMEYKYDYKNSNAETSSAEIQRLKDYSKEQKSRRRKPFRDTFVGGELRQIGYIATLVVCSVITAVLLNQTHTALVQ